MKKSKSEKQKNKEEEPQTKIIETFSAEPAINLVEQDPNLALAALRIEIERILRLAYKILIDPEASVKKGIGFLVKELHEHGAIGDRQSEALQQITRLCNEAVHGGRVSIKRNRDRLIIVDCLNLRL